MDVRALDSIFHRLTWKKRVSEGREIKPNLKFWLQRKVGRRAPARSETVGPGSESLGSVVEAVARNEPGPAVWVGWYVTEEGDEIQETNRAESRER